MSHIEVIKKFFTSLQEKKGDVLLSCYAPDAVFSDPLHGLLDAEMLFKKWHLFLEQAQELELTYGPITVLDDEYFTSDWAMSYAKSPMGKKLKVKLKGKSFFRLKDLQIIEHSDAYRFSTLIAQTHGWKGYWLGWTGYMKRKVKLEALEELNVEH